MGLIYHRPLGEYFSFVVVDQTLSAAVLLNAAYRKILLPTPRLLADSERLMSVTGLLCWRNSAFATYSSTSVFGLVASSEGSWQVLKDFLV